MPDDNPLLPDWLRSRLSAFVPNALAEGWERGILTPAYQQKAEAVPYVGPALGAYSHLLGAAQAVPGALFGGLQAGAATIAEGLASPFMNSDSAKRFGRDTAGILEALPFMHVGKPHGLPALEPAVRSVLADEAGTLKIPTKAGNVVRVDVRGPDNALLDVTPATGRAVGALLDEHEAAGGIKLYGGRGAGGPADVTVTLPPGLTRPIDVARKSEQMVAEATAMTQNIPPGQTAPRYWYKAGAEALHDVAGKDLEATQRLTAAHAITSPQTDVAGNSNAAVNAWNQSLLGGPIKVKTEPQNLALEETLYGSVLPESRKVGPFFENHMRNVDPVYLNNLTNDIWQMRQAGYRSLDKEGKPVPYSGTPGVGEDNFVRMMVDRATRQLNADNIDGGGWTPEQVQAVLWVHAKTSLQDGKATPASFNFANALEQLTSRQADAHFGGRGLLGDAAGDPQAQAALAGSGLLTDKHGRDIVNSSFGMLTPSNVPGGAAVSFTADAMKPSSRALLDASTLTRAILLRQPDALWSAHPVVKGLPPIRDANVAHVVTANPPELKAALDRAGGGLERAVLVPSPAGVRVMNVSELTGMDNARFQTAVKSAMDGAGIKADMQRARADYGYHAHDWNADPTGRGYIARIGKLPGILQRVSDQLLADLGGRIDAEASRLSGSQSTTGPWRAPGFAAAVGPEVSLPQRPWVQRADPNAPGSRLPGLLGVR